MSALSRAFGHEQQMSQLLLLQQYALSQTILQGLTEMSLIIRGASTTVVGSVVYGAEEDQQFSTSVLNVWRCTMTTLGKRLVRKSTKSAPVV
jgi:hypothetical protein